MHGVLMLLVCSASGACTDVVSRSAIFREKSNDMLPRCRRNPSCHSPMNDATALPDESHPLWIAILRVLSLPTAWKRRRYAAPARNRS